MEKQTMGNLSSERSETKLVLLGALAIIALVAIFFRMASCEESVGIRANYAKKLEAKYEGLSLGAGNGDVDE